MARRRTFHNNFEAGEMAPEFLLRSDTERASAGCKKLRNMMISTSGGARRRPGTKDGFAVADNGRTIIFDVDASTQRILHFTNGQLEILQLDGTLEDTVAGAPWTTADLDNMRFASFNGKIYVVGKNFFPQVIENDAGSWTVADHTFLTGGNGELKQPYFKFVDTIGISMTPSSLLVGSTTTLTASANFFVAGHVGLRLRLIGKEVQISAVNSPTSADALVIQQLFPTRQVTVVNDLGFQVGDAVKGDTTGIEGEVVALLGGNQLLIQHTSSYNDFDSTSQEKLVAPNAASKVTAVTTGTISAVLQWDEPLISPTRGNPTAVGFHRSRLIFSGVRDFPSVIAVSAVNAPGDFEVGDDPGDAFIESIGTAEAAEVRHIVSYELLIILTDKGAYYVPESNGFIPGQTAFFQVGPEGASLATPAKATEGVIFIDNATGRLLAIRPTGLQARPFEITELSDTSYHLLNSVKRVFVALGIEGRSERFLMCLNGDGTVAVMNFRRGGEVLGFGLWTMSGANIFKEIITSSTDTYAVGIFDGASRFVKFDDAALLDREQDYSSPLTGLDGAVLSVNWGGICAATGVVASGQIPKAAPGAGKFAGFDFTTELQPFPPIDERTGRMPKRIVRGFVSVLDSGGFRINGEFQSAYKGGDDLTVPPTLRTEEVPFYGFDSEDITDTPAITQDKCAPLHVRGITMEGRM